MFTFTFGECAENNVGMQKLGCMADPGGGLQLVDLQRAATEANAEGLVTEIWNLSEHCPLPKNVVPPAHVLVVRGAAYHVATPHAWSAELEQIEPLFDRKAKMRGRVVNKHARWNICVADEAQVPSYDDGKGRVVKFVDYSCMNDLREWLPSLFGSKAQGLYGEGNYYYDRSCGIGFHGDAERRRVIAVRLAASPAAWDMPIIYRWYQHSSPISKDIVIPLNPGDMYAMSEIAAGTNWKQKIAPTLRHATGSPKYVA